MSQVFVAIAAEKFLRGSSNASSSGAEEFHRVLDGIVNSLHGAAPLPGNAGVSYPGEGMLATRRENQAKGCPVDAEQWASLQQMCV